MTNSIDEPTSIGRNIERIRRLKGIKQDTLATDLGISRQLLSKIEQSDTVEEERLEQIAKVLGVTTDAIKRFNDDATVINIESMHDQSGIYQYHFNPIDKIVELYDALLKSEKEKNELLECMLKSQESHTKKK